MYRAIAKVNTVLGAIVTNNNNNKVDNSDNNNDDNNICTITNTIIKLLVTINRVHDKINNH